MKSQRKLVSPWEYTFDEFSHGMLFHPTGEQWGEQGHPFSLPLLVVNSLPHALRYLRGKSGKLVLIDPPYDYLGRQGVYQSHPTDENAIGLERASLSTFKDRVAVIPIAKEEDPFLSDMFGVNAPVQKWHFTQVLKAFMSRRYVPLRVMLNYEVPLARWAHRLKQKTGSDFLRLPRSVLKRQHGRDNRKDAHEYRIDSALDDGYFMGAFDEELQAYTFEDQPQFERELGYHSQHEEVIAIDTPVTHNNEPVYSEDVSYYFEKKVQQEQQLLAQSRPTPSTYLNRHP